MPKAYAVVTYHSIKDAEKLAAYAKLAGPSVAAAGGKFLVRSPAPAKVYEKGLMQRTVVCEYESLAKALASYESPAYKEALRVLGDGAVRDFRIVEGV